MGDGTKYLEGNYTASNPFTAIKEYAEDLKQAKDLDNAETYMEVWMQHLKDMRNEQHYLVDGSVLTCTRCTAEPQTPLKKSFTAPEGSKEVFLKVTQNTTAKNGAGQCFATLKDSKKFENIAPFGNCLNPPDRDKEKKAIELAEESEELRKLGTCRYLMKLSDEWENLISDTGYQKVTGQGGSLVETITMESVLFCKHGGFVYPIDPGYIMTDTDATFLTEEEIEFAKKYDLTERQYIALIDIRNYLKENPKLIEKTTIFAFEGLGTYLDASEESTWNGKNSFHPNGQFGAILIVCKEGKLSYAETRASTLPDNLEKSATVMEGTYSIQPVKHKSQDPNGYAAVQLKQFGTKDATLQAYNSIHDDGTISGVNLHMAGKIKNDKSVYSEGCITVSVDRYRDFGVATGFIKDLESNKMSGKNGIYSEAKKNLAYEENIEKEFEGYIVIDRKYYDAKEKYLTE